MCYYEDITYVLVSRKHRYLYIVSITNIYNKNDLINAKARLCINMDAVFNNLLCKIKPNC